LENAYTTAQGSVVRIHRLDLVEKGIMEAYDPALRDKLVGLRFRRNELNQDIANLQSSLKVHTTGISPKKVDRLAGLLKDKPENGPPEIRRLCQARHDGGFDNKSGHTHHRFKSDAGKRSDSGS
jgi:hypothetical protein